MNLRSALSVAMPLKLLIIFGSCVSLSLFSYDHYLAGGRRAAVLSVHPPAAERDVVRHQGAVPRHRRGHQLQPGDDGMSGVGEWVVCEWALAQRTIPVD